MNQVHAAAAAAVPSPYEIWLLYLFFSQCNIHLQMVYSFDLNFGCVWARKLMSTYANSALYVDILMKFGEQHFYYISFDIILKTLK